jgi:hypothetical protein
MESKIKYGPLEVPRRPRSYGMVRPLDRPLEKKCQRHEYAK